jgi:hypothetical protein
MKRRTEDGSLRSWLPPTAAMLLLLIACFAGCSSKGGGPADGGPEGDSGSADTSGAGGGGTGPGTGGGGGGGAGTGGVSGAGGSAGTGGGIGGRGSGGAAGGAGTGGGGGQGTGGNRGSGGVGGGGAGGGSGGAGGGSACPASMPQAGAACTGSASCSFGEEPSLDCRQRARCVGGLWAITPAPGYCTAPRDPACPATAALAIGAACDLGGPVCFYSSLCSCVPCNCDVAGCFPLCRGRPMGTPVWDCRAQSPSSGPACPAAIPNEGAPCTVPEGTACPDSPCFLQSGYDVRCTGGVWRWTSRSICPVG